jgi:hypothetical protein
MMQTSLETDGFVILESILNNEECLEMINGSWDYLEHISINWDKPISRNDESSWKQIISKLFLKKGFLNQFWNVGHHQSVWNVRQNPKIVSIFASLWKCPMENLLVSFDGVSFGIPPWMDKKK